MHEFVTNIKGYRGITVATETITTREGVKRAMHHPD